MKNSTIKRAFMLLCFLITISAYTQTLEVQGLGNTISNGDTTPSTTDDTDYGDVDLGNNSSHTFNFANTGNSHMHNVVITITGSSDFSPTSISIGTINKHKSTNESITFTPTVAGIQTATVTITSNDANNTPYSFTIQGNGLAPNPEIDVTGLGTSIPSGDTTPSTTDDTDYGSAVVSTTTTRTFTIENSGPSSSNLIVSNLGSGITITGGSGYFTINSEPALNSSISGGSSLTFSIDYSPAVVGTHTAVVSIDNNDASGGENPYTFTIQGTATPPAPEINITGLGTSIVSGDTTPSILDDTDFGTTGIGSPISHTFTIQNTGTLPLTVGAITFSGASALEFSVTSSPAGSVAAGGNTTFTVQFNPISTGTRPAVISIANGDTTGGENPYTFALEGYVTTLPPTYTIYYENFDENNGSWTASTGSTTNWSYGTGLTAISELGEGNYWYTNNYNNYSANAMATIESPIISTVGYNNLVFSADIRYDLETDTDDGMRVEYRKRTAGVWSSWSMLGSYSDTTGVNWYDGNGNVNAITSGSDGWTLNSDTSQTIHNYFETSKVNMPSSLENSAEIQFRFVFASDSDTSVDNGAAIDNIIIYADPIVAFSDPSIGPGSVTNNLKLWLKATSELGSIANGNDITSWTDNAFDNDAIGITSNSPTFHDNATDNINFNPVLTFDRSQEDYLRGKGGYFSHDYFIVIKSNGTIDNTGTNRQMAISGRVSNTSPQVDGTGFGTGSISARFTDEVASHMSSSVPKTTTTLESYGRAFTSATESYSDQLIIYNIKSNPAKTEVEIYKNGVKIDNSTGVTSDSGDPLSFYEFENQQYYIGTGRFSLNGNVGSFVDGKITEVISYKTTKSTLEQQKIHSYLALKNGITYHASNSTTAYNENDIDYIDSDGTVIWDTSNNSAYNFNIAGIGRDDASGLNQKQSSSSNDAVDATGPTEGIVSMGLTDIYDTNSANISSNTNTLNDKEFLVWGDNNVSLDAAPFTVSVDMSAGISGLSTPVSFISMQRTWKVVETGGDIGSVEVSIPTNAVRNISPPGSYLMFISDTGVFDPTADYRVMEEIGGDLYAKYDFDGTKYITFGYAPLITTVRSVYFDGVVDYIDVEDHLDLNPSEFTVSAWVKRGPNSANSSVLSKRNTSYTTGYDFKITNTGHFEMSWKNGSTQTITSNTVIPIDEWHQLAVIYDSGSAYLYIDGVLDKVASLSAPPSTSESFYIAAAGKNTPTDHFEGNIDEVRVWNVALTIDQLRYVMNQEMMENTGFASGNILPTSITKNEVSSIPWTDLAGYYPMSSYTYTNTNDESSYNNQGALRHLDTVDFQTAPLPYESEANGAWSTDATWVNNSVQTLPNDLSIVDGTTPINWNIVKTYHDVSIDTYSNLGRQRAVAGLYVDTSGSITINGDNTAATGNGLTVTHYLELDGSIDLDGESQLIQTASSVLTVGTNGSLERDQQGTADTYTYNYWSSPVGAVNTAATNNTYASRYTVPDVLMNGTTPSSPSSINFLTSGYNGSSSPFGIADYWIWKFANLSDGNYSLWQHMRSSGNILPGEGYTMKGPGTGSIATDQNYVFNGKPNNGDITLSISANNDYLIGNPYPSAIDSHKFLEDNPDTNGTLYYWEHWGGGSHYLSDYQGGYALYNYSGGVPSASYGTNDPDVGTGGTPTKLPGQYIPVSQGFFVYSPTGGTITFENDQRIFEKDDATGDNSTFVRVSSNTNDQPSTDIQDDRWKFRIGFNSSNGIHRQLLLTVDDNATDNFDWGYDGKLNEEQMDDMYWMIESGKYAIQGRNVVNTETVTPLGIHVRDNGINYITLDQVENVPDDTNIYAYDNVLNIYHDLRQSDYQVYLTSGNYHDRFAIVFTNPNETAQGLLSTDDFEQSNQIELFYDNEYLIIQNPNLFELESLELFNIIGQSIFYSNEIETQNYLEIKVPYLSSGTYIINLNKQDGKLTKKVLVK